MKRTPHLLFLSLLLILSLTACQESSITGTLGSESLKGTVVLSGNLEGGDPAGIEIRVPGTGISVQTQHDGQFLLTGLPKGDIDLVIRREDGIDEVRAVSTQAESVVVEITSRRGRGRPVSKPGRSIHGAILEVRESSILVDGAREGELELLVDENTIIYKGAVRLLLPELEEGELIHARVSDTEEGALLAESINVSPRHGGDPRFLPRSAVGEIVAIDGSDLTVQTDGHGDIIVRLDERTVIYHKNHTMDAEELEVGMYIKAFGVILTDEDVLLATWIRVKPNGEGDEDEDEGEDDGDEDGAVPGDVIATAEDSLVVRTAEGLEVTVLVDDATEIKHRGRAMAFADITVGMRVTAIGDRIDETTLEARKINVM